MPDPTKEQKDALAEAGAVEPLIDEPSLDFETRESGDSKENAKDGKPVGLEKKEKQIYENITNCFQILQLVFIKRINRVWKILNGEIAYFNNWWENVGTIFKQMGVAAAGVATSMFMSALCAFKDAEVSGLSALKSALFLSLSFAPEHKMKAQEEQIKTTRDATKSVQEQIKKMLDRHKPSAPPSCFDNQSTVVGVVVEDYKEDSLRYSSSNSGEDKTNNLEIDADLTVNNSLAIYNVLERTAEKETDINGNINKLYTRPNKFPRPRVTGFSEEYPTRYYVHDDTSDSKITTELPVSLSKDSATLSGEIKEITTGNKYKLYFKWREVGSGSWNETEKIDMLTNAPFQRGIDGLNNDNHYEYQAYVDVFDQANDGSTTFEETRSGEIIRFNPTDDSVTRSFNWNGKGRAIGSSILIEGKDKNTKPNIKDAVAEPINAEEYKFPKPDSLSEDDLFLIIDNSHRSNRELKLSDDFRLEKEFQEEESKDLPNITIHSKIADSSEPSEYELKWEGEEGEFIEDHENSECFKGLADKTEEVAESLKNYDNETEQEQMKQIGKEISAMADCLEFAMDKADQILEDNPQKNVKEIEDYDSIKDQLETIEQAGFDTSADNINLNSMGNFLKDKKEELKTMKSPERNLDESEKLSWGGNEVLSDNLKLEFLKDIRDAFKEIRNVLSTFKRLMQELSGMNVMMPGQITIGALSDFIDGLKSELFDLADFLEGGDVQVKIGVADNIGEIGGLLGMLGDLGEDLFNPDNVDLGTDFLSGVNDKLGKVQDLFTIIFRAIPYILYGEQQSKFISKYEELFDEKLYEGVGAVKDIIKDLKNENESIDDYYETNIKTWSGIFEIFTAWFEEGTTTITLMDKAMYHLTRVIQNLNRVIDGQEAISGSEIDRFTKTMRELFTEMRNEYPLEKIVGLLELYLAVYQMTNFFSTSHISQIQSNLSAMDEALPEDTNLSNSMANGNFESILNSEGGLSSCVEVLLISLKDYAVAWAASFSEEEKKGKKKKNEEESWMTTQEALDFVNGTIEFLQNWSKWIQDILDADLFGFLDEMCEDTNYAKQLEKDFKKMKKRMNQFTSGHISDAEIEKDDRLTQTSEDSEDSDESGEDGGDGGDGGNGSGDGGS